MPLGPKPWPPVYCNLPVVEQFKYLGIVITKDPNLAYTRNIAPLESLFTEKFKIWQNLPLSVMGRLNLNGSATQSPILTGTCKHMCSKSLL